MNEARREAERLAHALTITEERTRARIATELHDGLGQLLSMVRLRLHGLIALPAGADASSTVAGIDGLVGEAVTLLRSVTFELTSPVLAQLGLAAAIESLGPRVQADGGPVFSFVAHGEVRLDVEATGVVFRIVRELLLNARKHARAGAVWVMLRAEPDGLTITVRDDGVGCALDLDAAACTPSGGYGLSSSLAQMRGLGGTLSLRSRHGAGTEVTLHLPPARGTAVADGAAHRPALL